MILYFRLQTEQIKFEIGDFKTDVKIQVTSIKIKTT